MTKTKKICKECGEVNISSAMYCANCQASLNDEKIKENPQDILNYGTISANSSVVGTLGWLIIIILMAIPIVKFIAVIVMAFIWRNDNIRNYGKAMLILIALIFIFDYIISPFILGQ